MDERCESLADEYGVNGQTAQLIRPRDETTCSRRRLDADAPSREPRAGDGESAERMLRKDRT